MQLPLTLVSSAEITGKSVGTMLNIWGETSGGCNLNETSRQVYEDDPGGLQNAAIRVL